MGALFPTWLKGAAVHGEKHLVFFRFDLRQYELPTVAGEFVFDFCEVSHGKYPEPDDRQASAVR